MLVAVGLNHNTAPLELREQVAIGAPETIPALRQLSSDTGLKAAAILSTCNRTELYYRTNLSDIEVVKWLHEYRNLSPGQLQPHLYRHQDGEAVRHMFRVAAGLDSMILGEPEILGQMKKAYQMAQEASTVDVTLDRLFNYSFATAKQIRSDTEIGRRPVSVAFAAVSLARRLFGYFHDKTVLVIGAGETAELAIRHLTADRGVNHLVIANRSSTKARELADRFTGTAVTLGELPTWLPRADIVVSSTASPTPIVTTEMVKQAQQQRRRKPVFMLDLAVPRDIESDVGSLEDIYLYTVDDLKDVTRSGQELRRAAADQASSLVDEKTGEYMRWVRARRARELIAAYRQQLDAERERLLIRAKKQLSAGADPHSVLEEFAHRQSQALAHAPSEAIRRAGEDGRHDLLAAASEILSIREDESAD